MNFMLIKLGWCVVLSDAARVFFHVIQFSSRKTSTLLAYLYAKIFNEGIVSVSFHFCLPIRYRLLKSDTIYLFLNKQSWAKNGKEREKKNTVLSWVNRHLNILARVIVSLSAALLPGSRVSLHAIPFVWPISEPHKTLATEANQSQR